MTDQKEKYPSTTQMVDALSDEKNFNKEFANRLAQKQIVKKIVALRSAKSVSQAAIAEKLGCTQSRVSKLEQGKDDDLRLGELKAYAEALGLKVEIVLVPKDLKLTDRVKAHAFAIRKLLEEMVKFAHLDADIADAVAGFHGEAFFNLVRMLKTSCDKLPRRPEDDCPYIVMNVFDEEVSQRSERNRSEAHVTLPEPVA